MNTTNQWFRFNQNNSGGYFLVNEVVAEDVYVQAENAENAADRAAVIFAPYSEFCECCGERWPTTAWEGGFDVPTMYDTPATEIVADHFHKQARLHHLDGNVETVFYKSTKEHDDEDK